MMKLSTIIGNSIFAILVVGGYYLPMYLIWDNINEERVDIRELEIELKEMNLRLEREDMKVANYRMNNLKENEIWEVRNNGYYRHDGFYCVMTEGRNKEDIEMTKAHEQLHALILQGEHCHSGNVTCREHFCGGD